MPFFSLSTSVNHAFFALQNASIASQLSAPQITALKVINKMSISLCCLHLLTLGSFIVEKCVKIDEFAVFSVIAGLYFQKFPQNLPKINNF